MITAYLSIVFAEPRGGQVVTDACQLVIDLRGWLPAATLGGCPLPSPSPAMPPLGDGYFWGWIDIQNLMGEI